MSEKHVELITSTARLLELKDFLMESEYLAVDTETTGLQRFAEVIGVSLSPDADTGFYIPIQIAKVVEGQTQLICPWSASALLQIQRFMEEILLDRRRLITHNGVFDAKVIYNTFSFNIMPYIQYDTQLLHHTAISESPPHGLKPLAIKYLGENSDEAQLDLKESVIANGGKWTKEQKDMWMGDWKILGRYASYDTILTYGLFEKFLPELLKSEQLVKLWHEEVRPLMDVTYELCTNGIKVDLPYFEKLKIQMQHKITAIEDEVYALLKDQIDEYEFKRVLEDHLITPKSALGKVLKTNGFELTGEYSAAKELIMTWYRTKNNVNRVFNLDSPVDKAFLIYDVLCIPCTEFTAKGKRSTSKALLEQLAKDNEDSSIVLKLIQDRAKEIKLLSTYVEPILTSHENGRIYPSFNQTGTTSGRYSCGGANSLNLQTLPRDDHRIKAGFIPDEGQVFIAADYASLEPRSFAFVTGEPKIKKIFYEGLDFYSSIAIDVLGLKGVSANPDDPNYLGTVDKPKRQWIKAIALSIPYGAEAGRVMQLMKIPYEEAKEAVELYLKTYPKLRSWMDRSNLQMKINGYTESILGRRKRNTIVPLLYNKYKIRDFRKHQMMAFMDKHPDFYGMTDGVMLYLECRNALNVAKNHQIQSLSASIINCAAIDFLEEINRLGLDVKIVLNIHDELVVSCKAKDAKQVAEILQRKMEFNRVTKLIDVPMIAKPIITDVSLAEAK